MEEKIEKMRDEAIETCNGFYRPSLFDAGGSGEPMFRYDPNAINKERMRRTCMTCRGNEQKRLAHEIASTGHPNIHLNNNKEQCHRR